MLSAATRPDATERQKRKAKGYRSWRQCRANSGSVASDSQTPWHMPGALLAHGPLVRACTRYPKTFGVLSSDSWSARTCRQHQIRKQCADKNKDQTGTASVTERGKTKQKWAQEWGRFMAKVLDTAVRNEESPSCHHFCNHPAYQRCLET